MQHRFGRLNLTVRHVREELGTAGDERGDGAVEVVEPVEQELQGAAVFVGDDSGDLPAERDNTRR